MEFLPGQHVMIRFHDHLTRKYTPIWTEQIEDSKQTLLCLRIKQYPLQGRQNASSFLANCSINTTLDLYGPIGEKFYDQKTHCIIDHINGLSVDIKQHEVFFLAAGSGITPISQLAMATCNEKVRCTLITCDKAPDKMLMANELATLKQDCPSLLTWSCFFSEYKGSFELADKVVCERLSGQAIKALIKADYTKPLLVICGPDKWQEMIAENLGKHHQNHTLIVW